ncbi:MAG TPA: ATP-binding protein [Candidatus Kapabacteria bacterium]|nr:ATP-binding protein [Candidatus Kapabacteria bacterium]
MADPSVLLYSADTALRSFVKEAIDTSGIPNVKLVTRDAVPERSELKDILAIVMDLDHAEIEEGILSLLEQQDELSDVRIISPSDSPSIHHFDLPGSSAYLASTLFQLNNRRIHLADLRKIVLLYEDSVTGLVASRERYRSFLEQSSEGIWRFEFANPISLDQPMDQLIEKAYMTGYLAECNDAMAKMYGVGSVEDLIGKPLHEVLPADDPANQAMVGAFIESGFKLQDAETHEPDANGNIKIYLNNLVAQIENNAIVRVWGTQRDITAQRRAEEALLMLHERTELVVSSTDLGLWYCDLPFDNLEWNDQVKRHFGLPLETNVTVDLFFDLLHPDDREMTREAIQRSIDDHLPYDIVYRTMGPDGVSRSIRAIGRAFYKPDGTPARFDGITIDITKQKAAEQEREELLRQATEAREEAEAANRMKDQFLATLSHELRTPLNAILGWTQLLNVSLETQEVDRDELAEALEVIERNARVQAQLIEDLLDISRIISGKMQLQIEQTDVRAVIKAAIGTVEQAAIAKEIRIFAQFPDDLQPIPADQSRLQQIIWNLLSNAVKFTPRAGEIKVEVERSDDKYDIIISDSGQGIAPEFLPYVFDRFRQADATSTRKIGGLGLGLSIVRQLAELHGGSVAVDSLGEGKGTIFIVSLPVKLDPEKKNSQVMKATAASAVAQDKVFASLDGKRILVVDDEPDARELLRRLLESSNAFVSVASSVDEAETLLTSAQHDLIISDISMPERDGFDLIRTVRERHDAAVLPAIALTAYARTEDRARTLAAGFQEHLNKPLDANALHVAILQLIRK